MSPPRGRALLASAALVLCLAALACRGTTTDEVPEHPDTGPLVVRESPAGAVAGTPTSFEQKEEPKLFRLLDFARFKRLFKKTYASWIEELSRKRLFLARALRSFMSVLDFKSGKKSSFKSINVLSDRTPEERKRLLNRAMSKSSTEQKFTAEQVVEEGEDLREESATGLEEVERAAETSGIRDAEDVKRRMLEAAKSAGTAGEDASLSELRAREAASLRRSKRAAARLVEASKSSLSVAELMGAGGLSEDDQVAPSGGHVQRRKFRMDELGGLAFRGGGNMPSKNRGARPPGPAREAKGTVYEIDHRACLGAAQFQDDCGACFLFSSVSVLEWHYCMKNGGEHVQFSKQMPLDCQQTASCSGGFVRDVFEFASAVGLEPESSWPYLHHRGKCPFERPLEESPRAKNQAAFWKVSNLNFYQLAYEQWDEELKRGPLVINMAVDDAFPDYGGGVDEHEGCVPGEDTHAMALVGRGREDGKDFWLLRNSYGADWGERGHYKMSLAGMARCVWRDDDAALAIDGSRLRFRENRAHDAEKVADFIEKRAKRKADKLKRGKAS